MPLTTVRRSTDTFAPPAAAPEPVPPGARSCANCGRAVDESFCPRCGQETHDLHRSIGGIVGELLDAFAGWDSKVPMSIGLLLCHPGALTVEFLSGRRVRYLRPLRLYLTMSVLFFLSMGLVRTSRPSGISRTASSATIGGAVIRFDTGRDAADKGDALADDSALEAFAARRAGETGPGIEPWFKHRMKEGLRAVMRLPAEQRAPALQAAFFSKIGNAVFVLLPIFAALLRVLYRRAPIYFAEHFVFALHVHAFAMFGLMAMHLLSAVTAPRYGWVIAVAQLWIPAYLFMAMRRVYGGSRARTAIKFVAQTATYGPIMLAATAVTALYAVMQHAG
jgi:hypothetical protein